MCRNSKSCLLLAWDSSVSEAARATSSFRNGANPSMAARSAFWLSTWLVCLFIASVKEESQIEGGEGRGLKEEGD